MITPNDLLNASDTDLPKLLGAVLQPEKTDHKFPSGRVAVSGGPCMKCGKHTNYTQDDCFPDPIDTKDWNVAMKWRDWAVEECGAEEATKQMKLSCLVSPKVWWTLQAEPKHYLIAAALCKLKLDKQLKE